MSCPAKHTRYQPTEAEWKCPSCGGKVGEEFYIDEPVEGAEDGCELLHAEDVLVCTKCGGGWTGQTFSKMMARKNDLVACPTCGGTGTVKRRAHECN